ncbi:LysR family transcriptional regulator [Pseudomonas sp. NPDC089743]|uniref:LysR family transcriptional regulator n=1 Tax=Pseudomonas sp. NPDC089743 TaxID=3364471 RepID=UPI00380E4655
MPGVYTDFDPARLRCLDLNKLVVFIAVHRSSSASDAAATLSVTQPAISNTLSDLRDFFGDELFVRRGKRLHATPRADAIARYLEHSLIEEVFGRFSIQFR